MNIISPNKPYGISLAGKVRDHNEDSFLYTDEPLWQNQLAIVADGIGGNDNGEIASRLCCQHMYDLWCKNNAMSINELDKMETFMLEIMHEANRLIYQLNISRESDSESRFMGTTIVAAAFMPKDIVIVHAGDSRFYDYRSNGKLACLTIDHAPTIEIDPKNQKKYDIAASLQNLINRSIGTAQQLIEPPKKPFLNTIKRRTSSRYMLCSDGLTHMVDNEAIATILKNNPDNVRAVNKLISACFAAGATDNVSVILF